MSSYDGGFKIILLSNSEVDKSSMFPGYLAHQPPGVEIRAKSLSVDGKKIKLQIWDIRGEERFSFLLSIYVRGARGGLFLYDITNYSSIAHIDHWLNIIRKENRAKDMFPILVVGIITDEKRERQVSTEEGKEIVKSRNLNGFIECNIKTGKNVEKTFEALTRLILACEENFYLEKEKKMEKKTREDNYSKNYFKLKYNRSNVRSKFIRSKMDSARVLSVFTKIYSELRQILPQGKESYRDQIINLLSKIESFWDLTNSRIIAVALVQGKDTILYTTDNWGISPDIGRVNSSWSSMNAPFIMLSRVKYSVLQCTSERLVATSIRGESHILGAKNEVYTLILHVEPDPYIFTPPNPPDDFEMAPQVQLRAPLKEKEPEEEIFCQFCGMKLTKEEHLNHSCKKKPE